MKTKTTLLALATLGIASATALAGPRVVVSVNTGGYCAPRPVYYYRPAVVCRPVWTPQYVVPTAYYGQRRVVYSARPAVAPVYRVPRPIRTTVCRDTAFGWRR